MEEEERGKMRNARKARVEADQLASQLNSRSKINSAAAERTRHSEPHASFAKSVALHSLSTVCHGFSPPGTGRRRVVHRITRLHPPRDYAPIGIAVQRECGVRRGVAEGDAADDACRRCEGVV